MNPDVTSMFTATVSSTQSDSLTLAIAGNVSQATWTAALLPEDGNNPGGDDW